jgi:uncharacterized lipoprotein YmbA
MPPKAAKKGAVAAVVKEVNPADYLRKVFICYQAVKYFYNLTCLTILF